MNNQIYLRGYSFAKVKKLSGFMKHHSLPTVKNQTTTAFIRKIGAKELEDFSQSLFDSLKSVFSYKRKEIQFEAELGQVSIETPDFTIRILLDLSDEDISNYSLYTEVSRLKSLSILKNDSFLRVFDSLIDEIVVETNHSSNVEPIIDKIEALEDKNIQVKYPPSAQECTVLISGYEAELHFDHLGLRVQLQYGKSIYTLISCFSKFSELFPDSFIFK